VDNLFRSMDKNAVRGQGFLRSLTLPCKPDCGDITDVISANGVFGAESECQTPCPGDPFTYAAMAVG